MAAKKTTKVAKKRPSSLKRQNKKESLAEQKIPSKPKAQIKSSKSKNILAALFILIGLGALLFIFFKWFVVAWVDKMPVTRAEFYNQLDKRYGGEIKEQLITEKLVISESKKRNADVTEGEINTEYKKIQDQVGVDMLVNLLRQQNVSDGDFKNQLKLQLLVRKMFGKDIKVTDEDINKFLEENQTQSATNSAKLAKQKEQAKEQLTQQKISEKFRTWLQDAQKSARVVR